MNRETELRDRALSMFEASEERLTELEAAYKAAPQGEGFQPLAHLMEEGVRNSVLRELLGKDNRGDEQRAEPSGEWGPWGPEGRAGN